MKYSAFISYNHRDRTWARWLHRAIETYRTPRNLRGKEGAFGEITDRLKPVFRDRDELAASANLAQAVQDALAEAESLIVICSPHAVSSKWVNEEIRAFRRMGKGGRIFCLIVAGEPLSGDPETECLPPALLEDGHFEPLAADVRPGQDGRQGARLKLLASMLGVGYDELRQRENARRIRRLTILAAAASAAFLVTAGLAVTAYLARNEAIKQRDIARVRTVTAERTVDFVTNMFQVADPSEAKGSEITVREIVDQAAGQYGKQLEDEPTVRGQIGLTLSEVYGALGLYRQSDRLVREVGELDLSGTLIEARQALLKAESDFRLGKYDAAVAGFRRSVRIARADEGARETVLPRALAGLGQAYSALDRFDDAEKVLREALEIDRQRGAAGRRDLARDFEALGLNRFYAGDLEPARGYILRANRLRLELEGELSPSVSDNFNTLAAIAYFEGKPAEAERLYLSRLAIDEKVLGPEHPDVASTLNNIGRIRLERGEYRGAEQLLARAVSIAMKERGAEHDDMAFMLSNLALAREGTGDDSGAETLFRQALRAAHAQRHRLRGQIGVDLAALLCRQGRSGEGLALLDAARPALVSDYPGEAWRLALLENVRAECLWRTGRREEALSMYGRSLPAIRERWDAASSYGRAAAMRGRRIGARQ
jgi:tetratricopeptide (TPR) repeat protein